MNRIRRSLAAVLALLLLVGLVPMGISATAFTPAHSVIRVGINGHRCWRVTPSVSLSNTAGLRLGSYNADRQFVPSSNTTFTSLTVTGTGANVRVTDASGATIHTGSGVTIGPVDLNVTTTYTLPNASFGDGTRNTFHFYGGFRFGSSGGNMTVVNYVNLEAYIRGVVPYEAIPSWPIEVLKAQAVAARTFAVANFGRYQSHGFDVTNTTFCQVYRGTHAANANTDRAVQETAGQLILHNGRPIEAVYHSASGGATENSVNVWGGTRAYLQGTLDPNETAPAQIHWTRTFTPAQLLTHMRGRDSGFNLPDIANVIPTYTNLGNMLSVTFVASNGATRTYSREAARRVVIGGFTFNSQRFTIGRSGASGLDLELDLDLELNPLFFEPDVTEADLDLFPLDDLHIFHSEAELMAMAEGGLLDWDEPEEVDPLTSGTIFTITNYGFGHNVGMSQHGAASMARRGYTFDQIIRFYYENVTITGHTPNPPQPSPGFVDVSPQAWYYEAVQYVREHGLMNGTSPTTFEPQTTTTRGMFVTILGRMADVDPLQFSPRGTITGSVVNLRSGPSTNHPIIRTMPMGTSVRVIGQYANWFRLNVNGQVGYVRNDLLAIEWFWTDVAPGAFYAPYVAWAAYRGITEGTGEGVDGGNSFSPGRVMTRQEMATLLFRYANVMEITLQQDTTLPPFQDINSVADWARDAVVALQRADIIRGTGDGRFEPLGNSNRASVASMMMNFHRLYGSN